MPVFLLKSLLSVLIVLSALVGMYTAFEIFGRAERKLSIDLLKKMHRVNGVIFFLLYLLISYFCIRSLVLSKMELSPRGNFHAVLSLAVFILFLLKIWYLEVYRKYYSQAQTAGLLIALFTFGMFGTSGAYYFAVTELGKDRKTMEALEFRARNSPLPPRAEGMGGAGVRTGRESIERGRELFTSLCRACHLPDSERTTVGPGLKGILKRPALPVSGRPATPENVRRQLRTPLKQMPSFASLPAGDVEDLIAYMNTL
ncbi:MAG: cytochrome c [Alphaproteobacteria bacterium]|uniref:Cytochrome c n=1 Tax=Candidatus Nitrobium versatile TaxID=2884831 RepID=A0A953M1J0_9BACT|nr:cytochrome c [Candidatus Nitrobium versatile]